MQQFLPPTSDVILIQPTPSCPHASTFLSNYQDRYKALLSSPIAAAGIHTVRTNPDRNLIAVVVNDFSNRVPWLPLPL